ncbi:MAG: SDR family NAD(P)-dependent oxidoreductase [Spirochaetota bacterium]
MNDTHTLRTALVTGASSGIGLELARKLAEEGFDLVLVARSADRLEALAAELRKQHGHGVTVITADLSRPEAPEEVVRTVAEAGITVDVLVNNAGFANYGPYLHSDRQRELDMIQVNVTALTHLTHLLLPGMVERGGGRVLNVASTAAFQPGPLMAGYFATKAFVLHFSEAVASELSGTGVTVTALCPGPTSSGFQERAGMEGSKLLKFGTMSSRTVAEYGYRALMRGKRVAVPGFSNRLGTLAPRLLPRRIITKAVGSLQASE